MAVRIDQGKDLAVDFRLRERGGDKIVFPGAIALDLPVLNGAAAAGAEVLAKRLDAFSARLFDPEQLPPVRMVSRRGSDVHRLATECVGNEKVSSVGQRNAVAVMADMIDDKAFNHGARR
jgi:hypothetical protein